MSNQTNNSMAVNMLSSSPAAPVPASVTDWHAAWQAHVDAVAVYNARVAFARANEGKNFGSISVQAEYQLMDEARRRVFVLLPALFEGIGALLTASPADQVEDARPIRDILAERKHQDREWGGPEHDDSYHAEDWFGLIFAQPEKYWKALDRYEKYRDPGDEDDEQQFDRPAEVRRRLVKIAALAVAGMESIDRAAMSATPTTDKGSA